MFRTDFSSHVGFHPRQRIAADRRQKPEGRFALHGRDFEPCDCAPLGCRFVSGPLPAWPKRGRGSQRRRQSRHSPDRAPRSHHRVSPPSNKPSPPRRKPSSGLKRCHRRCHRQQDSRGSVSLQMRRTRCAPNIADLCRPDLPLYCAAPATYTTSGNYAACCEGSCVIPTDCTSEYHTDTPTNPANPAQITCTYTEFRQAAGPLGLCASTGIYPHPTGFQNDVTFMVGCDMDAASSVTLEEFPFPRVHVYRATQSPDASNGKLSKSEVIAMGVVIPTTLLTAVIAAWYHYSLRTRREAARRKTMLPAYNDCIREGRPPAYSPSPDSARPDGEEGEAGRRSRSRSPPPDYAASTGDLPATRGHALPRLPREENMSREETLASGQESYVLQELDRSTVDGLRREQENTEVDRGRT
ncbi:hypothetical protein B0T14DRAFT_530085 [Immersiella caudata]|uniref:Uncharacterized protein n=1 Tax=Immersiella caudata TaxID=314043 RepID=A0AA39U3Z3_9PEZI|nr:hypothetical protein B0T14DRAFT_530085 [Immersiella caudata]